MIVFPPQPPIPKVPNLCKEKWEAEKDLFDLEEDIVQLELDSIIADIDYLVDVRTEEYDYYVDLQDFERDVEALKTANTTLLNQINTKKAQVVTKKETLKDQEKILADFQDIEDDKKTALSVSSESLTTLISKVADIKRMVDFYLEITQSSMDEDEVTAAEGIITELLTVRATLVQNILTLSQSATSLATPPTLPSNIQQTILTLKQDIFRLEAEIERDLLDYLDLKEIFSIALDLENTILDQRIVLDTLDLEINDRLLQFKIAKLEKAISLATKKESINAQAFTCAYEKAISLGEEHREQERRIAELERDLFISNNLSLSNSLFVSSVVTSTFEGILLESGEQDTNEKLRSLLPLRENKRGPTNDIARNPVYDGSRYGFERIEIVKYAILKTSPIVTARITLTQNRYAYSSLTRVESEIFIGSPPQPNLISLKPQTVKVPNPYRVIKFDNRTPEDIQDEIDDYQDREDELTEQYDLIVGSTIFDAVQNVLELENTRRNLVKRKDNYLKELDKRTTLLAGTNILVPKASLVVENLDNEIELRKAEIKELSNRVKYSLEKDLCAPIASVSSGKGEPLSTTYPLAFTEEELKDSYATDMTKKNLPLVTVTFTIPYNQAIKPGDLLQLPSFSPISVQCMVLNIAQAFQVIREDKIIGQSQITCGVYRFVGTDPIPFPERFLTVVRQASSSRSTNRLK